MRTAADVTAVMPARTAIASARTRARGVANAAILIAMANKQAANAYRDMLIDIGLPVVCRRSPAEALQHTARRQFALIVLEVTPTDRAAFLIAGRIREQPLCADTPILFLVHQLEDLRHADETLGSIDYVIVPANTGIIRTKASAYVQLHRMRRDMEVQSEQRIALVREQAARAAAEKTIRRSAFLAEVSDLLSSSLDVTATARALVHFGVPFLADMVALSLNGEHGEAQGIELAWQTPAADRAQHATWHAVDSAALADALQPALLADGPTIVAHSDATRMQLRARADANGAWQPLRLGFDLGALAVLPLKARGRRLGALLLGASAARGGFDAYDIALAEDVAIRVAVSLDNCLLYARIQEADRRKNEFLAMLAHELRNPLAPICNAAHIIGAARLDADRLQRATDILKRQTHQLVRLVDDLLDVARITQGRIELRPEPVDVADIIDMALETSRPLIDSRGHQVRYRRPNAPIVIDGDRTRLAQVVTNILNNAAKYTAPGGHIDVVVACESQEVLMRVRDDGPGIPAHMLRSVFELFTQADRSLDRAQGGLGVGLTIAQRLVHMHGGLITAHSDGPGTGAEFVVRLPLSSKVPE